MNLLLVAPWCDPTDVGEAWVAYQWASRLSERHDVTLLTYYKRDRRPPSRFLGDHVRVIEWPDVPFVGRSERFNSLLKPGWFPFSLRARRWVEQALERGERFDVAHQVVPVAMRYPSPLYGLGFPYLLGPVGGSLDSPPGFAGDGDTAPWYVGLRNLDRMRLRHDPWLRRGFTDAACVLGIAPYVEESLVGIPLQRFEVMSETGLESLPDDTGPRADHDVVRLLYVGRLIRTKGVRDAIRAVARLRSGAPVAFDIVGDGFDRAACERLAAELGVDQRVRFHGALPRREVDRFYRDADVFLFPSYREPGGNVTLEAMGHALPAIVADVGGPAAAVDDTCGLRVHPVDPDQYATALAAAIDSLVADPALRHRLGEAARRRVASVGLWAAKVDAVDALYREVSR